MREPGASQFHILVRVSCCLLKEIVGMGLQKRNRLKTQALKYRDPREAFIINSKISSKCLPNFHESEKMPLKER